MNYIKLKATLQEKNLSTFSKFTLMTALNISEEAAISLLKRYKKKGYIKSPKRNIYFLADNPPSTFSLAYKIYAPSYISFETALSLYGIIPEVTYSVLSATTKATRDFPFDDTSFKYLKIKTEAFTGYIKKDEYFIATPEKALVDYLYISAIKGKNINQRMDLTGLDTQKIVQLSSLFKNARLNKMIQKFVKTNN